MLREKERRILALEAKLNPAPSAEQMDIKNMSKKELAAARDRIIEEYLISMLEDEFKNFMRKIKVARKKKALAVGKV